MTIADVNRREFLRRAGVFGGLVGFVTSRADGWLTSLFGRAEASASEATPAPPAEASGPVEVKSCDEFSPAWRTAFSADQTIQRVRPKESKAYILNPHKGTTTFQRFNGDPLYEGNRWNDAVGPVEFPPPPASLLNQRYPQTTMSYCRWVWNVIEPEKGQYRWDIIEGALRAAAERGQTLQMRLQPYAGGSGLPDWFWQTGAVKQAGSELPDENHPSYVKHWSEFIRAAGARFDGHPNLESFNVAYAGGCGETGGNTTKETAIKLVDTYLKAFPKTMLISMLGTDGCAYAAKLNRAMGWRGDCLGDLHQDLRGVIPANLGWNQMYDGYPKEVWTGGVQEAWKKAPVTGETCWTVGYWYENNFDIDWIIEQALMYHHSVFMPKSCYIPEAWADKIENFNKKLGYRFVLRQTMLPLEAKRGEKISLPVWVDNMGVAPIYRPYQLALRFRQREVEVVAPFKEDIRTWLPGQKWFEEPITIPANLHPGPAKVDIGLIDPATKQPKVRFAIEGVREDGWHPMTLVDIA